MWYLLFALCASLVAGQCEFPLSGSGSCTFTYDSKFVLDGTDETFLALNEQPVVVYFYATSGSDFILEHSLGEVQLDLVDGKYMLVAEETNSFGSRLSGSLLTFLMLFCFFTVRERKTQFLVVMVLALAALPLVRMDPPVTIKVYVPASAAFEFELVGDELYANVGNDLLEKVYRIPCDGCVAYSTEFSCPAGQYIDTTSEFVKCSSCPSNCGSCDSGIACGTCAAGSFKNTDGLCTPCSCTYESYTYPNCPAGSTSNICSACPGNCATCTGPSACTGCIDKTFALSAGACTKIPCITGCSVCYSTTTCETCSKGYFKSGTTCTACGNGGPSDYTCGSGFYKDGTACTGIATSDTQTCAACPSNCLSCTGSTCNKCAAGYVINGNACNLCPNGGTTYTCASGEYKTGSACTGDSSTNTQTCAACDSAISGCNTCNSATVCTACNTNFYLASANTCTACASACGAGQFESQACSTTANQNRQCTSCSSQCATCTSATSCSACNSGFFLASATTCSACASACGAGQYESQACSTTANQNRQCTSCSTAIGSCASCTSATVCTACSSGFYLASPNTCTACTTCLANQYESQACSTTGNQNRQCTNCPANCATCDSGTNCLTCDTGFSVSSGACVADCTVTNCKTCVSGSTTECSECNANFFLESATSCKACNVCSNFQTQACSPTANQDKICGNCADIQCATCPVDAATCTQCAPNFFLPAGGTCTACSVDPAVCSACSSPDGCSAGTCDTISGGQCLPPP